MTAADLIEILRTQDPKATCQREQRRGDIVIPVIVILTAVFVVSGVIAILYEVSRP